MSKPVRLTRMRLNSGLRTQNSELAVPTAEAVIQVSGLAGQGIVAILECGLAYRGGTGAFVARTVKGTDGEIVGFA